MKEELLTAISDTVQEISETMLFLEIQPGHGIAKPSGVAHIPAQAEASVMVALNGGMNGGVRVACSTDVARLLASSFAGEGYNSLKGEAKDAFAEIGNMIAGGVQTRVTDTIKEVGEINLTPPTVIIGKDYEVEYKSNLESVRYFFRLEDDHFYVELHYLLNVKSLINLEMPALEIARLDDLAERTNLDRSTLVQQLVNESRAKLKALSQNEE